LILSASGNSLPDEPLILTEENAELVLQAARDNLTTLFGYLPENQKVGISGQHHIGSNRGGIIVVATAFVVVTVVVIIVMWN